MNIEQEKISSLQLMALIFFSVSGAVGIFYPGSIVGNNMWLAYLAGFLAALLLVWIVLKLYNYYPGKNLIEINEYIYGPLGGKIISLLYVWYFFHLATKILHHYAAYISTVMLNLTPREVIILCTLALAAYMVYNGVQVMGRCALALLPAILFIFLFILSTISNEIKPVALLPIMDIPVRDFLKATFNTAIYPFGEIIIYLMLFRFLSEQKKLGSSIIWGMSLGMINIVALTLLAITVLQNLGSIYTYPVHAMITRIDIANIITRVDVLGGSAGLLLGIMKIAVLYYAATLGAAQLLKLSSYTPLVLPMGLLLFDFSILQFPDANSVFNYHIMTYPYFAMIFEFIFPALTLSLAWARKKVPERVSSG
ncbi:MAG: GerAB/ArcD/ProY family transporter [Syntrophomonadaceae bacterium]|jgi:spore germination protein KB|nr:endospore germination permease [Syntrophomonadaceae bacterium]